jgi:probable selenium-dependent hydroxylase accessory protein YqeC
LFVLQPRALHVVANATLKALRCFCLFGYERKFKPPAVGVVVDYCHYYEYILKGTMDLISAFGIDPEKNELIAFSGSGGKTTAIFALARALKEQSTKVLITTTTNIYYPTVDQCDAVILDDLYDVHLFEHIEAGTIVCFGGGLLSDTGKIKSVEPAFLNELFNKKIIDYILVEADGAKCRPIKAPAAYEPVIPAEATLTVGVIGLDALGMPADEVHVHRLQLFCDLTGLRQGEAVSEESVARLIRNRKGLFKGAPEKGRKIILLNKADDRLLLQRAGSIIEKIENMASGIEAVLIASMAQGTVYDRHLLQQK